MVLQSTCLTLITQIKHLSCTRSHLLPVEHCGTFSSARLELPSSPPACSDSPVLVLLRPLQGPLIPPPDPAALNQLVTRGPLITEIKRFADTPSLPSQHPPPPPTAAARREMRCGPGRTFDYELSRESRTDSFVQCRCALSPGVTEAFGPPVRRADAS